jgi:hypothetical protein
MGQLWVIQVGVIENVGEGAFRTQVQTLADGELFLLRPRQVHCAWPFNISNDSAARIPYRAENC